MKRMTLFFSCLLTFIVIFSSNRSTMGADLAGTTAAFTTHCTASVRAKRGTDSLNIFERVSLGKNSNYKINVHKRKTDGMDVKQIIVWVGKGSSTLEIPRVTDICFDGNPQTNFDKGDIDFKTMPGHTVPITFHLNGFSTIKWKQPDGKKAKPSDSIWLVHCTGECPDEQHPYRSDWPDCLPNPPDKDGYVQFSNHGLDMSFLLCLRTTGDHYYKYELHMDQTDNDGSANVDVAIDPKIINHPS
jgi:hypothetical protein